MNIILDKIKLQILLEAKIFKIHEFNNQMTVLFFYYIQLVNRGDIPKNYLSTKSIPIIVPSAHIGREFK